MSKYVRKRRTVSILPCHIVCPAKYRRIAVKKEMDNTIKETCEEISKRHEIKFIGGGTEGNHAHFLARSAPTYSPTKIVTIIKSI
ncbi:MAG: IS200/IS605 family transposase [Treponema sp.]|jgi:REP element-mobilizing transposase RayT|nr:IS200/IS605 family transposase [Treponema sp.]